jgi:hypothetical protein
MKLVIALITILLIAGSATPSSSEEHLGPWALGGIVIGVNVLTGTMNGIFSYTDPPRRGPILLGIISGTGSALLGSYLLSVAEPDNDPEIFGLGAAMTATGLASIAFAFINSNQVSKHRRQASVNPDISLNLRDDRAIQIGISVEF